MKYRVELSRQAKRAFLALPKRDRRLVGRRLRDLAEDPRPHGAKALTKTLKGYFRLRAAPIALSTPSRMTSRSSS